MKRTIVIFGVLIAFLCATFGAYAVENATWGRIKATCSERLSETPAGLTSTGPRFLSSTQPLAKRAKHDKADKTVAPVEEGFFYAEELIRADEGGKLEVGDKQHGKSKLIVPENALSKDKVLSMKVPKHGDLIARISEAVFGEHGTVFATPAKVELSYKGASLTDIDEEQLRAWYYNEETGAWECIGGTVDLKKKKVTFRIHHFSRYGLAPR